MIPYQLQTPKSLDEPAHLYVLGEIVEGSFTFPGEASPVSIQEAMAEAGAKELVVHIDSYGGDSSAGITIHNLLKNSGVKVTTIAEGFCCSAASLIFMAGSTRIMRNSALLMIHNAWTITQGNAEQLRKDADTLDKVSAASAEIYKANIAIPDEQLAALLAEESWLTAEEALEYGFATAIEADRKADGAFSSAFSTIRTKILEKCEPKPKKLTPFEAYYKNFYNKGE